MKFLNFFCKYRRGTSWCPGIVRSLKKPLRFGRVWGSLRAKRKKTVVRFRKQNQDRKKNRIKSTKIKKLQKHGISVQQKNTRLKSSRHLTRFHSFVTMGLADCYGQKCRALKSWRPKKYLTSRVIACTWLLTPAVKIQIQVCDKNDWKYQIRLVFLTSTKS